MILIISAFSLGISRRIEDELLVRSTRNKLQLHITLFTKYLVLYNCWVGGGVGGAQREGTLDKINLRSN